MTKTTVSAGWTDAQIKQLTEGYTGDNSKLGDLVAGKSVAMCRSKLVSLGLYKKADETAALKPDGTATAKKLGKTQLVSAIEILLSMPVDSLNTMEKASKGQLEALAATLAKLSNKAAADQGLREPEPADEAISEPISEAVNINGM